MKPGMTLKKAQELRKLKGIKDTKLQRLRVKRNLSQTELAERSGVTASMIKCYEQRTRSIDGAKLSTLCKLSKELGCKIEDILEDESLIVEYRSVK